MLLVAEPIDHAIGRSRGGRVVIEVRELTDSRGRELVVLSTTGNYDDTATLSSLPASLRFVPGRTVMRTDDPRCDEPARDHARRARPW